MRTFKKSIATVAIAGLVLASVSCKKDFYTNANINHNAPAVVPSSTLLSGVEMTMGYSLGGDFSRFASMFVQQTYGASRQAAAYYGYVLTNQDPESAWDNWYDDVMKNDLILMKQAQATNQHAYTGLSQILMAYSLQVAVDCWGSIPYTQALQGENGILYPTYDNDQTLYGTAMSLCDQGIANINAAGADAIVPGGDDFIYGGNLTQWVKFAHAIKARLYIHQTKHAVAPSTDANCDSAIAEVGRSFSSNADDAQVVYGASANTNGPWYQFNQQRTDIEFAYEGFTPGSYTTFGDSLIMEMDPRYTTLIDSSSASGELSASGIGLGNFYGGPTAPVVYISYSELQFIVAEALLRTVGVGAPAQAAYTAGITANFNKLGVAVGTFTTTSTQAILPATAAAAIVQNAWQENIALYLNPEAWTLWRRCNWTITPTNGSNGVPRRFLYPQSEIGLNTSAAGIASAATQWTPVIFWDK